MIYRPDPDFRLWDTWIFPAGDEFHLFHLQNSVGDIWDTLGHAVSTDLIHWEKKEPIPMRGSEGAWDSGALLTGMVIRYNDRYAMTYGSDGANGIQQIGIMFSSDLYHWDKYQGNPVLRPAGPYLPGDDWRDAYVTKFDDNYEALVCARLKDKRACIARMESRDLINWKPLPPVFVSSFSQCELPEYFCLGERHYLIFCSCKTPLLDEKSRKQTKATRYLISDHRLGEYKLPDDSLLLGSGNGRFDCYAGRTIEAFGERMLYYHNVGSRPSAGAPKVIKQFADGQLWVEYWPGLAGLETKILHTGISGEDLLDSAGSWKTDGKRLIGMSENQFSASILTQRVDDFHLTCTFNVEKGNRTYVIFRYNETSRCGAAIAIDVKQGKIEIGCIEAAGFVAMDTYYTDIQNSKDYAVRIFARSEFVDCYINNRFLFSTVFEDNPVSGRIGFAVDSGLVSFGGLRVAALEHE